MSKDEEAVDLARRHYEIEPGMLDVIRFTDTAEVEISPAEPIKLLEVNENTVPAGIMPIYFGPAPSAGFLCPSVIVEITPEEYEKVKSKELALPPGWKFPLAIPRPTAAKPQ